MRLLPLFILLLIASLHAAENRQVPVTPANQDASSRHIQEPKHPPEVTVEVTIKPDGTLQEVNIIKSSGDKSIDNAVIELINKSQPFEPFSKELAERTDKIKLIRTIRLENLNENLPKK